MVLRYGFRINVRHYISTGNYHTNFKLKTLDS